MLFEINIKIKSRTQFTCYSGTPKFMVRAIYFLQYYSKKFILAKLNKQTNMTSSCLHLNWFLGSLLQNFPANKTNKSQLYELVTIINWRMPIQTKSTSRVGTMISSQLLISYRTLNGNYEILYKILQSSLV